MAQAVRYKKPRKINAVSVSIALALALVGWLTYQYLPPFLMKQEAYRVLDETASKFSGSKSRYLEVESEFVQLRMEMQNNLRLVGIKDPRMESWIEVDDEHNVRFGVLYSYYIEWPWNVIAKQEKVVELEYDLHLQ